METLRFLADVDTESEENRFPGWPLTIDQLDNDGRRPLGYLPRLRFEKPDQVLKIVNEKMKESVRAIRIKGNDYVPTEYDLAKGHVVGRRGAKGKNNQ